MKKVTAIPAELCSELTQCSPQTNLKRTRLREPEVSISTISLLLSTEVTIVFRLIFFHQTAHIGSISGSISLEFRLAGSASLWGFSKIRQ